MTAPQSPTAGAGVDVPAATLGRYAGKYEMTTLGGLLMTVELQGGQLRLQLPGQPALVEKTGAVDLTTYAGRYFSDELETFYDMSVEGGQLVIRHRRFGPAALTHTSGDTFSGTLPVSQVVFRRDAQGKVTGFDAGNGRARDIAFKKASR